MVNISWGVTVRVGQDLWSLERIRCEEEAINDKR
jgi:hypothetical protein